MFIFWGLVLCYAYYQYLSCMILYFCFIVLLVISLSSWMIVVVQLFCFFLFCLYNPSSCGRLDLRCSRMWFRRGLHIFKVSISQPSLCHDFCSECWRQDIAIYFASSVFSTRPAYLPVSHFTQWNFRTVMFSYHILHINKMASCFVIKNSRWTKTLSTVESRTGAESLSILCK
jgi:hypothetical protein